MSNLNKLEDFEFLFQNPQTQKLLQNPLIIKDIWHIENDLNLKVVKHNSNNTLNFTNLSQSWLNLLAKLYIISKKNKLQASTIKGHLYTLNKFSKFIKKINIDNPSQINNQVFEDFDYYLQSLSLSDRTVSLQHIYLSSFFDTCRIEGWLDVNTYWFKGKRKAISQPINNEIDYIPEEVWNQLEEHLYLLPEQIQRMVLIIKSTGLRGGELLNLPFDCLRKRGNQWRLRLMSEKYEIEDEMPIQVTELVAIIKEQQKYIINLFGDNYMNLFCSNGGKTIITDTGWELKKPTPRIMYLSTFNRWLNQLAKKVNIRSAKGEIWHFNSHQFRKTVATVMTNAGVRDLIIQKYLRHRNPDMQDHYKHLMKQVLGDEYQELVKEKKYVDITGKIVASHKPTNLVTEALRRRMYQITTQYGECHRPTLKNPCPTVNACWKCKDWRVSSDDLPYLKDDLQRVKGELKAAIALGMTRQKQGLEDDFNSLNNCIKGLESNG
jgi:integrase